MASEVAHLLSASLKPALRNHEIWIFHRLSCLFPNYWLSFFTSLFLSICDFIAVWIEDTFVDSEILIDQGLAWLIWILVLMAMSPLVCLAMAAKAVPHFLGLSYTWMVALSWSVGG